MPIEPDEQQFTEIAGLQRAALVCCESGAEPVLGPLGS